ncbi:MULTISPECIES: N-acetyltransferase [unclassified Psychrobacter]|uniref:N-acetyltransferase n=1 Tax=unclassified Psychrobacter TaxID=196806 RepID=UPI0025B4B398|nr:MULTISPECIES: N-acetyltransferase [unclassified Psychrobacter]MDN3454337.1 N-acetyltransferase [Psychrobacter sp. APC 3350]MDN3503873.1 N-acetyltransferase [Psychrobacter sp. 5A.1]
MNIHPTAIVSDKAIINTNVRIGAYTIIYDNVEIAENTIIEAFCEIGIANNFSNGDKLYIGANSHIRSHSIFYEGSVFLESLITGHRVTVREKVQAGKNLQIGTLSDLQGHCEIGDFVRFHSNVHIGQKSKIGNFVWIFPYVVLTNDPHPPSDTLLGVTVEDYAVIATMSVILPGTIISNGCLIGAHSSVKGITEADTIYAGSPAKKICSTSKIQLNDGSGNAYPWRKHFHRGYPEEIIKLWISE